MNPTEIWKPIEGYENYEVSNHGHVRNTKKDGRLMTACRVTHGYLAVSLSKDGKRRFRLLHRLVAEAFIPNPDGKPQVNHKDRVKTNNCIDNLEWVTCEENITHAVLTAPPGNDRQSFHIGVRKRKKCEESISDLWVTPLRSMREAKGMSQEELAEAALVRLDTIQRLENGTKLFRDVNVNTASKLAWVLGTNINTLAGHDVAKALERERQRRKSGKSYNGAHAEI